MIDTLEFGEDGKVRRFISREKIDKWKEIEKSVPILLITFNTINNEVYYTTMSTILQCAGVNNADRCGYYIYRDRCIYNFK